MAKFVSWGMGKGLQKLCKLYGGITVIGKDNTAVTYDENGKVKEKKAKRDQTKKGV